MENSRREPEIWKRKMRLPADDLAGIKKELEELAAEGWMLQGKEGRRFIFVKSEKRRLNFAVEVFDKASQYFDDGPNEQNLEYIEYCEKAGWHFICSAGMIQFFYSEDLELTPIETDIQMKFQSLKNYYGKSMLPSLFLLLIGIWYMGAVITDNSYGVLLSFLGCTLCVIFLGTIFVAVYEIIRYIQWNRRCKQSILCGNGLIVCRQWKIGTSCMIIAVLIGLWVTAGVVTWVKYGQTSEVIVSVMFFIGMLLNPFEKVIQRELQKKRINPAAEKKMTIAFSSVMLMILLVFLWNTILLQQKASVIYDTTETAETPVTVKELGLVTKEEGGSYIHKNLGKFLLSLDQYVIDTGGDYLERKQLLYFVYQTESPAIYNQLVRDVKKDQYRNGKIGFDFSSAVELTGLQGAEGWYYETPEVGEERGSYHYLLFYYKQIVNMQSDFKLTQEQLEMINASFSSKVEHKK